MIYHKGTLGGIDILITVQFVLGSGETRLSVLCFHLLLQPIRAPVPVSTPMTTDSIFFKVG